MFPGTLILSLGLPGFSALIHYFSSAVALTILMWLGDGGEASAHENTFHVHQPSHYSPNMLLDAK